jgi:ribose/xylose/arabinose/galactoside ABC-type transport system permease subunit
MSFLLGHTAYGKALYATGANPIVAALSGVRTGRTRVVTYGLSAALGALGGFVLLGYTGSVFLNLGEPYTYFRSPPLSSEERDCRAVWDIIPVLCQEHSC